jgi:hypothetical protein
LDEESSDLPGIWRQTPNNRTRGDLPFTESSAGGSIVCICFLAAAAEEVGDLDLKLLNTSRKSNDMFLVENRTLVLGK